MENASEHGIPYHGVILPIRTIIVVLLLVTVTAYLYTSGESDAATSGTTGDCTWTLEGTELTISGSGRMGSESLFPPWGRSVTSVTIGDSVTHIGSYSFYGCTSLTSVTIGESVVSIGSRAFWGCESLASVTIPGSVMSVGSSAFGGCTSLNAFNVSPDNKTYCSVDGVLFDKGMGTLVQYPMKKEGGSYTIPGSVTSIGRYAFSGCTDLNSVTIPDSVTNLGEYAFESCTSLKSLGVPNSVTSIGDSAFRSCTSLESVTVPYSVTSLGMLAFNGCTSLTAILVSEDNGSYCSADGVLFDKGMGTLIQYPEGKQGAAYTIPGTVTSIGDYAFYSCISLTDVTISHSVKSIGNSAFSGCSALVGIEMPDSVSSIGNASFQGCIALARVDIPDSVKSMGYSAFADCTSLTSVKISVSIPSIRSYAFGECSSLTSIAVPDSVTDICDDAFENCTSLVSVSLGNSVRYIDNYAFKGCSALKNIAIPDSVTSVGYGAFMDCSSLETVTLGNTVTSIGGQSFKGCSSLTGIIIPNSVTSIRSQAFKGCMSLACIVIPDSVTVIGEEAFEGCVFHDSSGNVLKADAVDLSGHMFHGADPLSLVMTDSHSPVPGVAVPATKVSTGLTAGTHCSVCGMVVEAQKEVPALPSDAQKTEVTAESGTATVSKDSLQTVIDEGLCLDVDGGGISVEIPSSVLETITKGASGDMKLDFGTVSIESLSDSQREAAKGSAVILSFELAVGSDAVHQLGGRVEVTVDFVLGEGKDAENIYVAFIKDDGTVEKVDCTYRDGKLMFSTDHFSLYAVMYAEPPSDSGISDIVLAAALLVAVLTIATVLAVTDLRMRRA